MDNGSTKLYNVLMGNPNYNNAIGRTAGTMAVNNDNRNFFQKRWDSIKNTFGTTGAAVASAVKDSMQNTNTELMLDDNKNKMNNIVRKYGYNSLDDYYNDLDDAEINDKAKYNNLLNTIQEELKAQSSANMDAMRKNQADYKDWVDNNYASNQLKQDRGKFLGSAINTLSTAVDLTGLSATPLANSIQGGVEGVADELEQNGLENFDWGRAGQNAAIGATTGLVTGALNKGISNSLAKKGGNLFKGGNKVTNWLNEAGSKNALGRVGSTIATGAGRGAVSGAVGGATGAGMSALFNGGNVIESALQGAVQGAKQGATTGGIMAGANMAISKTPGVGKFYNDLQNAKANWDKSGSNFDERLTNTLNSGDSAIGDWLNRKTTSRFVNSAGNLGNSIYGYEPDQDSIPGLRGKKWDDSDETTYDYVDSATKRRTEFSSDDVKRLANNFKTGEPKLIARGEPRIMNMDDDGWTLVELYARNNPSLDGETHLDNIRNIAQVGTKQNNEFLKWVDNIKTQVAPNYVGVDTLGNRTEYTPAEFQRLLQEYDNTYSPKDHSMLMSNGSSSEVDDVVGRAGGELMNIYKTMHGGIEVDPYNRQSWEQFDDWVANQRQSLRGQTPTTAKGWLKRAGERIIEDANDRGVGMSIQNVKGKQIDTDDIFKNYGDEYDRLYNARSAADAEIDSNADYFDNVVSKDDELMDFVRTLVSERQDAFSSDREVAALVNTLRNKGLISSDSTNNMTNNLREGDTFVKNGEEFVVEKGQGRDPEMLAGVSKDRKVITSLPNAQVDAWDRVAQEAGYNNYDDVIRAYMDANPNTPLNPRGAAGQILTWLDQNPNTPTTAGEWAKRAGQRIIEDANERGVGLGIRNVEETPETEVYRRLTGQNIQEPQNRTLENTVENDIVPSKASKETKMRYAQGKELLAQYGTVDQPTARATRAAESFQEIADMGFTKPEDVERISNAVTGSNGAVSKLTKSVIASAAPVDTFSGAEEGQTMDDYINRLIDDNALYETQQGKSVKQMIAANLRSLPSHAAGSVTFQDSAEDTFKVVQKLESKAAELEGRGGNRYSRPTVENMSQARVLKDVANLLKDRIYDGADVKTALTPEVVNNLKALDPKNEAWAKTIDDFKANAKSPQDLRSFQRPFVRASKYIDNQYIQAATAGGRMAANAGELPSILPTTKAGLIKQAVNSVWNSNPAHRLRANLYGKIADRAANTNTSVAAENTPEVTNATINPAATQLYNAIGRTEGAINANNARNGNYLANTAQEAEIVPNTASLESLLTPTTNAQTSIYNSLYGSPTTTMAQTPKTGYFDATGDYWTDIIASAMSSAIDNNDVNAFASLYGMYQDALANLQKQNSSTTGTKLTATQQRANAAMNSLERLSTMTPDLGYNLSNIPVIGNIATFGGNDYEAEAKSLAQQIGYMVSGSNIKETEAEAIGKAYVPQPWDNEQTRQNKLRRAYEIISQYQNGYAEA